MPDVLCTVKLRAPQSLGICHVAVGQKVFSFGGHTRSDRYLNVHVFNTVSLKWTKVFPRDDTCYKDNREVPCNRWANTGVLIDNVIYILGGRSFQFCRPYILRPWRLELEFCRNVLHAFDVNTHTWLHTEVSGTVPEARYFHSACVSGKVMYIYGGSTQHGGRTNDTYKLDTTTMVWSLIETRGTAPASYRHSASIIGTKMFVCGYDNNRDTNTIRVFDTETNHWLTTPFPVTHSVAFAYNGELYTFGDRENSHQCHGHQKCTALHPPRISNLWKYSPETLSRKKVKPKGDGLFPMFGGSCCVVGDRVVVFGSKVVYVGGNVAYILDFSPSLKTLCQLAVLQYGLEQSELPHNIREELAAMTMTDDHTSRSNVIAEHSLLQPC